MDTHKMNVITNIQQLQERLGYNKDQFDNIKTYDIGFLEKKRDKLIKEFNKITSNLKPIKDTGISAFEIEFPEDSGEYHLFEIAHNNNYIVVGSSTNTGLLADFWIKKDDTFTLDEHLEAVYELIQESLLNDEELSGLIEL